MELTYVCHFVRSEFCFIKVCHKRCWNMHKHKEKFVFSHTCKVLLQPAESFFVNVSKIVYSVTGVEIIINYDIVSVAAIKREMLWTEVSFKSFVRRFVSTSEIIHIMISDSTENRHIKRFHGFHIVWEKPWRIAHDVTAVHTENFHSGVCVFKGDIVCNNGFVLLHIFHRCHLSICMNKKDVVCNINVGFFQTKVVSILRCEFFVKLGDSRVFHFRFIAGRSGDIHKTCIGECEKRVFAVNVCADNIHSVCHSHVCNTFIAIVNTAAYKSCLQPLS